MALKALTGVASPSFQRSAVARRCPSPRCHSPRYLQHTIASAGRLDSPSTLVEPPNHSSFADATNGPYVVHAAGGSPNNRFSISRALDLGVEEPRRRLRRSLSAPRSLGSRSEAARRGSIDELLQVAEKRRDAELKARYAEFSEPAGWSDRAGALVARHDVSISIAQSPKQSWFTSSHDKSLPNAPRSKRASGHCKPNRVLQVTPDALAAAPPVLVSDSGFDSTVMRRRARGSCSPIACRPTADPNQHAAERQPAAGTGLGSSLSKNIISPSRRALGVCSPGMCRAGSAAALALQWD